MKVVYAARAARQLAGQIDYLITINARGAAAQMEKSLAQFLNHLSAFPHISHRIPERDLWEARVPGTQLVLWYRIEAETLYVVALWHVRQDR